MSEAEKFLNQAAICENRIELLIDKIERLKDMRFRITSQLGSDVVSGTRSKSKLEDITLNLVDLECELETEQAALPFMKLAVRSIIAKVDDIKQREILTERYINRKPMVQIAFEQGTSKRNAYRVHKEAIRSVERIINDDRK